MRRRNLLSALLIPALAACAAGGSGGSGPAMLSMGMPSGGTATYEMADTTIIAVDAGGQVLEIPAFASSTVNFTFAENMDGGVRATATWAALDAMMSNPMGAPERASLDQVDGQLVFDMDRMGNASIVELPDLSGNAETMVSPEGVAYGMFPSFPGAAPEPGLMWTDTVSFVVDRAGSFTETTSVHEWTVVGEEMYEGRSVLRLEYTSSTEMQTDGVQMGMAIQQDLAGGGEGYVLWDLSANRMELHQFEASLEGVMNADQMPMPLPLSVTSTQTMRRVAGGM